MRIHVAIYSFVIKVLFRRKFHTIAHYKDFDPKRMDPYILIGNHPFLQDGIYSCTYLKEPPLPVINTFMFTSPLMKFVLTKLYPSIPKRKGQSDIYTIRAMMRVLKKGLGVMIYPEGNASFYGEGSPISITTSKFLKKMKQDIVVCKTNGAYLTAPRWGDHAIKKGLIEFDFYTLYKKEELQSVSVEEIHQKVTEALAFNDFDWNRQKQHKYHPKKRAEGIERYIYVCPKCKKHQTISSKGNDIYCKHCGKIATFNDYCFLEGLKFDNLIDWNLLQKKELPRISKEILYTYGKMYDVDTTKYTSKKIGKVDIELIDNTLHVQHRLKEYRFDLDILKGLTLTRKDEISFDYEEKTYFIKMKDPMLFYDVIKFKHGG